MRSSNRLFILFLFLAATAIAPGCSSSQTSGEDASYDMLGSPESKADAVGSIPEDMLANEEANTEATPGDALATEETTDGASTSASTSTDSTTKDATTAEAGKDGADPFADLTADATSGSTAAATSSDQSTDSSSSSATTGSTETYTVKSGDTLMKIAFTIYGDIDRWKDLKDWNQGKMKSNAQLKVGTTLTYEPPLQPFSQSELAHSYTIKQGDTLAGIADEVYGRKMKFKKLQRYNDSLIKNANRIFAGFTIFYDITDKEMAEAETRRQERTAQGGAAADTSGMGSLGGLSAPSTAIPTSGVISTITPPTSSLPKAAPIAVMPPPSGMAVPIAPPPASGAHPGPASTTIQ